MANEDAPSSNLMMENVRLQAKLNTPEGLRAGYTASLEGGTPTPRSVLDPGFLLSAVDTTCLT